MGGIMIVNSTDLKNNLGKYLRECVKEEIIITKSGRKIAKLIAFKERPEHKTKTDIESYVISEEAEAYHYYPKKISYEEFLELTENSKKRYEYIDGEVYLIASPKTLHQKILGEVYMQFYNWFKGKQCVPMLSPYDITLYREGKPENINVVQPDLVVICDLEEKLNEKDYYMGTPALVIEILSESTRRKDFVKKLDLYMSTGIKEYWIINPFNNEVSIYCFKDNDIISNATYKKDETAGIVLKDIFI